LPTMSLSTSSLLALTLIAVANADTVVKTVYRITPRNYTGITNLDTGDAAGDAFFGIYELQAPVECSGSASGNHQNLLCSNEPILQIPQFNVYEQFQVEMDSRFGDYAECNPSSEAPHDFGCTHFHHSGSCWYNDPKNPQWATEFASVCSKSECECDVIESKAVGSENINTTFGAFSNQSYPQSCVAEGFRQYNNYFPKGIPGKVVTGISEADCCSKCSSLGKFCKGYGYEYDKGVCTPFTVLFTGEPRPGSSLGFSDPSDPAIRTLELQTGKLASIMNGTWYSTQAAGECQPGQKIGDGDCYWRVLNMTRNVNATCVNNNLVQAAIAVRPTCWQGCPQPTNQSSLCWIQCLFDTVTGNPQKNVPPMKREQLVSAFEASFSPDGGCPEVPPCPTPCVPPHAGAVIATSPSNPSKPSKSLLH